MRMKKLKLSWLAHRVFTSAKNLLLGNIFGSYRQRK